MRILSSLSLLFIFAIGSVSAVAEQIPVAQWSLDENSGQTIQDSSVNNLDLQLNNVSNSSWGTGKFGSSVYLDGSTQDISTATASQLQAPSITLSAWV